MANVQAGNQTRPLKVKLLSGTHTRLGEKRRERLKYKKDDVFEVSEHEYEAIGAHRLEILRDETPSQYKEIARRPVDMYAIRNAGGANWVVENTETSKALTDPMSRDKAVEALKAIHGGLAEDLISDYFGKGSPDASADDEGDQELIVEKGNEGGGAEA